MHWGRVGAGNCACSATFCGFEQLTALAAMTTTARRRIGNLRNRAARRMGTGPWEHFRSQFGKSAAFWYRAKEAMHILGLHSPAPAALQGARHDHLRGRKPKGGRAANYGPSFEEGGSAILNSGFADFYRWFGSVSWVGSERDERRL